MFFIKIKVKGHLKNLTDNTEELIETDAIKKANVISYIDNKTKYKILVDSTKITLIRENDEFSHQIVFEKNIKYKSEYYLKKFNNSLEFNILTTRIIIKENTIEIDYKIIESESLYNYVIEMSDN